MATPPKERHFVTDMVGDTRVQVRCGEVFHARARNILVYDLRQWAPMKNRCDMCVTLLKGDVRFRTDDGRVIFVDGDGNSVGFTVVV